jgi:hypothetical protein
MADDPLRPWAKRPPYLQRWVDPRNGAVHVYYRRAGAQKRPLKSPWGTQALADEVEALAAAHVSKPKPEAGTIVAAIREYRGDRARGVEASADFLALAASTQIEYERLCDEFEITFDGVLAADVDAGYVLALRDKWAKRGYRAANQRLQVFKNICKPLRIRGEIAGNPFDLIDKVARPQSLGIANPRWLDEEFEAALERAIETHRPGLARALALGRWGGFRRQTICSVPRRARIWRTNEDGVRERRIYWVTEKKLVLCDRREDPRLTALLERTEQMRPRFAKNVASLTIAYNSYGEAWKKRALGHAIEDLVATLAKEGLCRPGLTIHGLRHARGVELALAGASDAGIMSQLDHATPRQAAEYRKQAERLGLADAAQDQVDARVTKLRTRAAQRGQSKTD